MSDARVLVAAGRTLFRQGLVAIISGHPGLDVVADAANADEARRRAANDRPDLILVDSDIAQTADGCDLIACLRSAAPKAAIVVLGEADRDAASEEAKEEALRSERAHALAQGAAAYLPARADQGELIRLLTAVVKAHSCGDGETDTPSATPDHSEPVHHLGGHRITDREHSIVAMIAQGMCNKEVAHRLGISTQTVKNHVSHLLDKLALADRTQLAVFAVEHKLEY